MDRERKMILVLGVSEDLLDGLRGDDDVVNLASAEQVGDWLWEKGASIAEVVIGPDADDPNLREVLARDWPGIRVRRV